MVAILTFKTGITKYLTVHHDGITLDSVQCKAFLPIVYQRIASMAILLNIIEKFKVLPG